MGWSCTKAASDVMDKWSKACTAQTGSSNTFRANGQEFFFEPSRVEHDDGAITGTIHKIITQNGCVRVGPFRINGDGSIARAPKFLKDAAK